MAETGADLLACAGWAATGVATLVFFCDLLRKPTKTMPSGSGSRGTQGRNFFLRAWGLPCPVGSRRRGIGESGRIDLICLWKQLKDHQTRHVELGPSRVPEVGWLLGRVRLRAILPILLKGASVAVQSRGLQMCFGDCRHAHLEHQAEGRERRVL